MQMLDASKRCTASCGAETMEGCAKGTGMASGSSGHATELPSKAMSALSPCTSRLATESTRPLEEESTSGFQMPLTVAACSSSSGPESGGCDMTRGLEPHATPPARRHPALATARTRPTL